MSTLHPTFQQKEKENGNKPEPSELLLIVQHLTSLSDVRDLHEYPPSFGNIGFHQNLDPKLIYTLSTRVETLTIPHLVYSKAMVCIVHKIRNDSSCEILRKDFLRKGEIDEIKDGKYRLLPKLIEGAYHGGEIGTQCFFLLVDFNNFVTSQYKKTLAAVNEHCSQSDRYYNTESDLQYVDSAVEHTVLSVNNQRNVDQPRHMSIVHVLHTLFSTTLCWLRLMADVNPFEDEEDGSKVFAKICTATPWIRDAFSYIKENVNAKPIVEEHLHDADIDDYRYDFKFNHMQQTYLFAAKCVRISNNKEYNSTVGVVLHDSHSKNIDEYEVVQPGLFQDFLAYEKGRLYRDTVNPPQRSAEEKIQNIERIAKKIISLHQLNVKTKIYLVLETLDDRSQAMCYFKLLMDKIINDDNEMLVSITFILNTVTSDHGTLSFLNPQSPGFQGRKSTSTMAGLSVMHFRADRKYRENYMIIILRYNKIPENSYFCLHKRVLSMIDKQNEFYALRLLSYHRLKDFISNFTIIKNNNLMHSRCYFYIKNKGVGYSDSDGRVIRSFIHYEDLLKQRGLSSHHLNGPASEFHQNYYSQAEEEIQHDIPDYRVTMFRRHKRNPTYVSCPVKAKHFDRCSNICIESTPGGDSRTDSKEKSFLLQKMSTTLFLHDVSQSKTKKTANVVIQKRDRVETPSSYQLPSCFQIPHGHLDFDSFSSIETLDETCVKRPNNNLYDMSSFHYCGTTHQGFMISLMNICSFHFECVQTPLKFFTSNFFKGEEMIKYLQLTGQDPADTDGIQVILPPTDQEVAGPSPSLGFASFEEEEVALDEQDSSSMDPFVVGHRSIFSTEESTTDDFICEACFDHDCNSLHLLGDGNVIDNRNRW